MNTVVCPHCGKDVEISQAFKHQIEEDILREERSKHKEELEKFSEDIEKKAEKRIKEEVELTLKNSANELEEVRKKSDKLQNDLLDQMKAFRKLQDEQQQKEVEMEKKLLTERERIQEELSKSLKEKSDLENAELKKQLDDTKKALVEAQRKAEQKSQQLQGEVLELEMENLLRTAFPHDAIEPVGKGITGADIKHIVKSPKGFVCGTILWESKRTKEWSDKWLGKLKEDLRSEKALCAVIVSMVLPKEAENGFGIKEGVWICSYDLIVPVATSLRKNLLDVGYQKAISANKGGKADVLYNYITSHEFQQQVENVVESYREQLVQITKERAAFEKSWKQREAQAQRILVSTANIVGSMQGIVGASLPPIKGLDLLEEGAEENLLD
ncbi:MAG TPA: DUF2130 domain-containing protein [Methylomirabilota bacterium]|nr:DUF2130 domain-containing protein [Methylomirabilota bacterium]